jgi:hypothetical protein
MAHSLILMAAETVPLETGGVNPWVVGGGLLLLLLLVLLAVITFGGGREHS